MIETKALADQAGNLAHEFVQVAQAGGSAAYVSSSLQLDGTPFQCLRTICYALLEAAN